MFTYIIYFSGSNFIWISHFSADSSQCVIQGSRLGLGMGPAAYVLTAANLKPKHEGNQICRRNVYECVGREQRNVQRRTHAHRWLSREKQPPVELFRKHTGKRRRHWMLYFYNIWRPWHPTTQHLRITVKQNLTSSTQLLSVFSITFTQNAPSQLPH